jgi:hypothetical protein
VAGSDDTMAPPAAPTDKPSDTAAAAAAAAAAAEPPTDEKKKAAGKKKDDKKADELVRALARAAWAEYADTSVVGHTQSEEDQLLKAQLEQLVETLQGADAALHLPVLEALRTHIRTSTSSMTSVPKPLKFLRPHYPKLAQRYDSLTDVRTQVRTCPACPKASGRGQAEQADAVVWVRVRQRNLADILSVLAMTMGDPKQRATLRYRLAGSDEPIGTYGHEFVRYGACVRSPPSSCERVLSMSVCGVGWGGGCGNRYLSSEVIAEYNDRAARLDEAVRFDDLHALAREIVPFNMAHNAEADACDLLMELERIGDIVAHVDKTNYARVCLYLTTYAPTHHGHTLCGSRLTAAHATQVCELCARAGGPPHSRRRAGHLSAARAAARGAHHRAPHERPRHRQGHFRHVPRPVRPAPPTPCPCPATQRKAPALPCNAVPCNTAQRSTACQGVTHTRARCVNDSPFLCFCYCATVPVRVLARRKQGGEAAAGVHPGAAAGALPDRRRGTG